jgi:hypothetical protein
MELVDDWVSGPQPSTGQPYTNAFYPMKMANGKLHCVYTAQGSSQVLYYTTRAASNGALTPIANPVITVASLVGNVSVKFDVVSEAVGDATGDTMADPTSYKHLLVSCYLDDGYVWNATTQSQAFALILQLLANDSTRSEAITEFADSGELFI